MNKLFSAIIALLLVPAMIAGSFYGMSALEDRLNPEVPIVIQQPPAFPIPNATIWLAPTGASCGADAQWSGNLFVSVCVSFIPPVTAEFREVPRIEATVDFKDGEGVSLCGPEQVRLNDFFHVRDDENRSIYGGEEVSFPFTDHLPNGERCALRLFAASATITLYMEMDGRLDPNFDEKGNSHIDDWDAVWTAEWSA